MRVHCLSAGIAGRCMGYLLLALAALGLAGCAANQSTKTGYLDRYDDLVASADGKTAVYLRPGFTPAEFESVVVDMVGFAGKSVRLDGLSAEERDALKLHLTLGLERRLVPELAPAPAANGVPSAVLRRAKLRAAITDFDAPNTAMNVVMAVVLVPLSTGGASTEFEIRDAASDQLLLAMTCSDAGSVTSWKGMKEAFGRLDHAKTVLDACADKLAAQWRQTPGTATGAAPTLAPPGTGVGGG